MSHWPRAILFDFDGVIVNSEPLHLAAFQQVLTAEHIALSEDEYYRELIGFDDRGAFQHIFQRRGKALEPAQLRRMMTRKSQAMMAVIRQGRYAALPGVEQLIRGLSRHYPLAICSGALRAEIEGMLDGLELRECFPIIVAAEDVTVGKPDPQGYLMAAKLIGERTGKKIGPGDCLIIEDAPAVIRSVRTAGFQVLAVATSYPIKQLSEANYAVNQLDPSDVAKAIPQLVMRD